MMNNRLLKALVIMLGITTIVLFFFLPDKSNDENINCDIYNNNLELPHSYPEYNNEVGSKCYLQIGSVVTINKNYPQKYMIVEQVLISDANGDLQRKYKVVEYPWGYFEKENLVVFDIMGHQVMDIYYLAPWTTVQ